MVSSKGGRHGFVFKTRFKAFRALRKRGKTKKQAAQIANAGHTHAQRVVMAKKAAKTRKRRGK